MKKLALLVLIIVSTLGCKIEDSVSINLTNKSQYEISDVKVFINIGVTNLLLLDSIEMPNVMPGDEITKVLSESKLPKSDGGFYLRFKQNGSILGKEFGYFSNGSLLDKQYNILLTNDDVTVSTK